MGQVSESLPRQLVLLLSQVDGYPGLNFFLGVTKTFWIAAVGDQNLVGWTGVQNGVQFDVTPASVLLLAWRMVFV